MFTYILFFFRIKIYKACYSNCNVMIIGAGFLEIIISKYLTKIEINHIRKKKLFLRNMELY